MKIIKAISDFNKIKQGCVFTIGNFDGVHFGHQRILKEVRKIAEQRNAESVVMTFEPHPVAILHPEKAPYVLTPLALKIDLLKDYVDGCVIVLEDSKDLLSLSPEDFIDKLLIQTIKPSLIIEGEDFNFGVDRQGNVQTLKDLGAKKGFEVAVVPPEKVRLAMGQSIRVSSTMIRYMLESGHVSDAAVALSRPYRLIGRIIPGKGRGKQLGFPTLNMQKPKQVIPAEGVYAGFVGIADYEEQLLQRQQRIPSVFSIGQARTFTDEHPLLIEAHLLVKQVDNMTDKWMAMDFLGRLRSQHKFSTPEALAKQIAKDCETAKKMLTDRQQ
jgi:riboflavin kinase/FMN adenylyltransferase